MSGRAQYITNQHGPESSGGILVLHVGRRNVEGRLSRIVDWCNAIYTAQSLK